MKAVELAAAMRAIVETLAAHGAPIDSEYDNCHLCGADIDRELDDRYDRADLHVASCPWRMARELIHSMPV